MGPRRGAWLAVAVVSLAAAGPAPAQESVPVRVAGMERFVAAGPAGRPLVFWHDPRDGAVARALARTSEGFVPAPVAALSLPPDTFTVVLAASEADFAELTGGRVPDWGLAVAFPSLRRVVVRSPRLTGQSPVDPAVVLRHELGHLYLAAAVEREDALPQWFHEGFAAVYAEEWRWVAPAQLAWARVTRRLTPLEALADSFPGRGDPSVAYVQSMAAMRDLRDRGGDEGVARLLARVRAGASFDAALRETYGLTLDQYYDGWAENLGRYGWLVALTDQRGIWIAVAVLVALLYLVRRRGIRREIARRRAAEDAALGDPDDHSLGVEAQDRYWEQEDEAWRGDDEDDDGAAPR
jgi:hypothetical protein